MLETKIDELKQAVENLTRAFKEHTKPSIDNSKQEDCCKEEKLEKPKRGRKKKEKPEAEQENENTFVRAPYQPSVVNVDKQEEAISTVSCDDIRLMAKKLVDCDNTGDGLAAAKKIMAELGVDKIDNTPEDKKVILYNMFRKAAEEWNTVQ